MKNKKLTYILLPAVIVVWILVIVNLIKGFKKPDIDSDDIVMPRYINKSDSVETVYRLNLKYSDPFLKDRIAVTKPTSSVSIEKKINSRVNTRLSERNRRPKRVVWPEIIYFGLVESEKVMGLIQVNGKKHIAESGDEIAEITVSKVYPDSVFMEYEKELKTFIKKKNEE